MINENSKFGVLLLFAIGILSFNSFGQTKCDLQIGVYEFKEDGSSEQFPVPDAKIKLVNNKTGKSLKISQNANALLFSGIDEGEYELTVSKKGFKKTRNIFSIDCDWADAQNAFSMIVFLWKGNSKETVKFGKSGSVGGYYNITGDQPVNNGAVTLIRPAYPAAARAGRVSGKVEVQVTINELGYVISAKAVSGHPLLQWASVKAARESKFRMTFLEGIPVKVTGIIVYNFVP